jgi:hypothetical protein
MVRIRGVLPRCLGGLRPLRSGSGESHALHPRVATGRRYPARPIRVDYLSRSTKLGVGRRAGRPTHGRRGLGSSADASPVDVGISAIGLRSPAPWWKDEVDKGTIKDLGVVGSGGPM